MRATISISLLLLFVAVGCAEADEAAPEDRVEWMHRHADLYLESPQWRRNVLEESLWAPDLPYARKRLAGYGLGESGWDLLPEMTGVVQSVTPGSDSGATTDLVPAELPETREQWLALGERVFWSMPMRRDGYLDWIVDRPELWDEVGLQADENGAARGVVRFEDARGDVRLAATCGLCHGDGGVAGRAARRLDLGKGRALFTEAMGGSAPDYASWGPGTVDVTDDGVVDALAIPDLWGAKYQQFINHSGAVALESPAALAVRFETQFIVGHSLEQRPNRVLTWALAMFVLDLEPPTAQLGDAGPRGKDVFDARCASCHDPERGFSGGLVDATEITSDPTAAFSAFRGTGFYKVPSLVGISGGGPYLHDASATDLAALVDGGHPTAQPLSADDREALLQFLQTL